MRKGSFKTRIAAGLATLGLLGGAGLAAATSASAATPSCGSKCVSAYTEKYGSQQVLDNFHASNTVGNFQILFQRSNSDQALDYTYALDGTVDSIAAADPALVPANLKVNYGNDEAAEVRYSPYGVNSSKCVGTWPGTASSGFRLRLEPCGQGPNTLLVVDEANAKFIKGHLFAPIMIAAQTSFSDPLVLNEPGAGPTSTPRPVIDVLPENTYSDGTVFDNQMWSAAGGVFK